MKYLVIIAFVGLPFVGLSCSSPPTRRHTTTIIEEEERTIDREIIDEGDSSLKPEQDGTRRVTVRTETEERVLREDVISR